ncbi:hypothetical protein [Amycolatopsis sp. NPDC059021]|uniref:terpene synthase family protein n=1 Tax=Amycolatopsis sp. NPDC059021 TaxID=3346704 RepID=UPI0036707C6E
MPREPHLDIPFDWHPNPELPAARERHIVWARRFGLLDDPGLARRYTASNTVDIATFLAPDARGAGLDLIVDLAGCFFLFDDQFDLPPGQWPTDAVALCHDCMNVVTSNSPAAPGTARLLAAFADFWQRTLAGRPAWWRALIIADWIGYFEGCLTEVTAHHTAGSRIGVDDYLAYRRATIGQRPTVDTIEAALGCDIPSTARTSPLPAAMLTLTVEANLLINDYYSLEKDEACDTPNLITSLMHDRGWSRSRAVAQVAEQTARLAHRFLTLKQDIPGLCDQLGLNAHDREHVHLYIDILQNTVVGSARWSEVADRYTPAAVSQVARTGSGVWQHDTTLAPLPNQPTTPSTW